jgi:hypothetical protein
LAKKHKAGARDAPPREYVEQIEAMRDYIIAWLFRYPGAKPAFRLPPQEAMVIVPLFAVTDRVAGNSDARDLLIGLIECFESRKAPTLFMLRIALSQTRLPVSTVRLSTFLEGFDYAFGPLR